MRKGKEIIGLPVVDLSSGGRLGVVKDLVIDLDRRLAAAMLLSDAARGESARLVPFESIRQLGPDAIMLESGAAVVSASERPQLQALLESPVQLAGMVVLTAGGKKLGTISDVVVDERSGAIEEYEISAGPIRDAVMGRVRIPDAAIRALGKDLMIVPEPVEAGRRGLEREAPPVALEAPPGFEPLPVMGEIDQLSAQLVDQQVDLIVGCRAQRTVANEDSGGVIVFNGGTITEETVRLAKAAGKLNELVQASGEAGVAAMSMGTVEMYSRVAVGRMAGMTVHTPDGEVLVSQGDVVTPEVVRRAREAGVLDQLMEAVRGARGSTPEPWATGRSAARALWEQVGERVAWLTGKR